jgi:hypothetical protein
MTHHGGMTADPQNAAAPGETGRDWVAALPAELAGQRPILDGLLDFCAAAREWAFLGWCALADLGKYLRRGSLWEARARLEEARVQLWKLQAAAGQVAQPQHGLTSILDFAPGLVAPEMAATVAGLEPAALLAAAQLVARLLSEAGAGLRPEQRAALPAAMARYITADLAGLELGAPARA